MKKHPRNHDHYKERHENAKRTLEGLRQRREAAQADSDAGRPHTHKAKVEHAHRKEQDAKDAALEAKFRAERGL